MSRPKNGVLLVTTPPDWRPHGVNTVPAEILSARWYVRNLNQRDAVATTKSWNKAHLGAAFEGEWALCVRSIRKGPAPQHGKGGDA